MDEQMDNGQKVITIAHTEHSSGGPKTSWDLKFAVDQPSIKFDQASAFQFYISISVYLCFFSQCKKKQHFCI